MTPVTIEPASVSCGIRRASGGRHIARLHRCGRLVTGPHDSTVVHGHRERQRARAFAQERAFAPVALHQMHAKALLVALHDGDNETRKASSGAKVNPCLRFGRQCGELSRIGDVARPDFG